MAHWGYFAVFSTFGDFGCIMKSLQINWEFLVLLMILVFLMILVVFSTFGDLASFSFIMKILQINGQFLVLLLILLVLTLLFTVLSEF